MEEQSNRFKRYLNPYCFMLYFWTFLLTGLLAHWSLIEHLRFDPKLSAPGLWLVIIMLFFFVVGFRIPLLDLLSSMSYREKVGIFFFCLVLFFAPVFIWWRSATLLYCLLALQAPLLLLMVDARGFRRVLANNLLILSCFCLEHSTQTQKSVLVVAISLLLVTVCLTLDFFSFRSERGGEAATVHLARAHWLALKYYLAAGGVAFLLFWIKPVAPKVLVPFKADGVVSRTPETKPSIRELLNPGDIEQIVYQTFFIILLMLAGIALLQFLRKKILRRDRASEPVIKKGMAHMIELAKAPKRIIKLKKSSDPREAILQAYYWFCRRADALGLAPSSCQTPRELERAIAHSFPTACKMLQEITRKFEQTKYGWHRPQLAEAKSYQQLVKDFFQEIS